MKLTIELKHDLAILLGLSFMFTLGVHFWQLSLGRVALGLLFLLAFPGYTLVAALFPGVNDLDGVERGVLSFGMSIVVVGFIGLFLNYTPWGIQVASVMTSVTSLVAVGSCVAYYRRARIPIEDRFVLRFEVDVLRWKSRNFLEKSLSLMLALSIMAAIGMLGLLVSDAKLGESFTEFYGLDSEKTAGNFLRIVVAGQPVPLILGISNQETAASSYSIAALAAETPIGYLGPLELNPGEDWEGEFTFVMTAPGENQRVDILLEREGFEFPYRSLRLWIDVEPAEDPY